MKIRVFFYSYFKDLTGTSETTEELREGATLEDLVHRLSGRFPKFGAMRKAILMAVGVEYQKADYQLKKGDEVSFFPPVQGG